MSTEKNITFLTASEPLSDQTIDVGSMDKVIGIFFQVGYNTTNMTFTAIMNDGKIGDITDASQAEYEITVDNTKSQYIPLDPALFAGVNKIRLRRGTAGTPYSTAPENTVITLVLRRY
jgi:hypothetical protein